MVFKVALGFADYKPVVFALFGSGNWKKNCACFQFYVWFRFGFGVYVKAFIGFKAFYFFRFSFISVYICEMALSIRDGIISASTMSSSRYCSSINTKYPKNQSSF